MEGIVKAEKYLDRTLAKYAQMYDIFESYDFAGKTFPAYAYFSQHGEKYVLSKKAQLWQVNGFEHVLFVMKDRLTSEDVKWSRDLMADHMAPILVCKGNKYPEKDHMVSNLTVVFISDKTPDEETRKQIKSFSYDKGYLFSFRGHVDGRIVCCDMEAEDVYTNRAGKQLKKSFLSTFSEVEKNLKGYSDIKAEIYHTGTDV
ncbi:MAG: hypothetical protein PUB39_07450 [Eubacteriales bacterium]|nr:hypothetical protein [Eubacteriales bacterium]